MADLTKWLDSRDENQLQDMGLRRLPRQDAKPVQSSGGDWRLSLHALRVHYNHLSSQLPTTETCRLCVSGLEGALEKIEEKPEPTKPSEVGKDNGDHPEADTTLPPSDWPYNTAY